MEWCTPLPAINYPVSLHWRQHLLTMGSCFADSIGKKLQQHAMDVAINPVGIHFNFFTLCQAINRALTGAPIELSELQEADGLHFHWAFQRGYAHKDPQQSVQHMNASLTQLRKSLLRADWLFVTGGTSIVHRHIARDEIVANCHKRPQGLFEREMLDISFQVGILERTVRSLLEQRPQLQILWTVSPVRHLRHGFIDNTRSKARLLEVVHRIREIFTSHCHYFPSYELVMDTLRDYRWYKPDMIHLDQPGIDHIWHRLTSSLCDQETIGYLKQMERYNSMVSHEVVHPDSLAGRAFAQKITRTTQKLISQYPEISSRLKSKTQ